MLVSKKKLEFIKATLKQIDDSVYLVNTTTKPDIFFKRLNMTLDLILCLMPYDKKKIFTGKTMEQNYKGIINDLENIVNAFIDRAVVDNQQKTSSLKTTKLKQKNYENFVISLISAFDCANSFWSGNASTHQAPHYDGPLFTEANYKRVQKLYDELPDDLLDDHDEIIQDHKIHSIEYYFQKDDEALERLNAGDNDAYLDHREAEFGAFDVLYDTGTIEGIDAIPVPEKILSKRAYEKGSVTGRAEYILTLRAGDHERNGNIDLAICCFRKANELRQTYEVNPYSKYDYMRLVETLKRARRFDEARIEEEKINRLFDLAKPTVDDIKKKLLAQCREIDSKTDLVEMSSINAWCETCAKYRGRVFSLYGADKRFPLFPDDYHDNCGLIPWPFIYGVNEPQYCSGNIIKFSNRPFIDDRTPKEKEDYKAALLKLEEDKLRDLDKQDYDWLWEHMPEICPKSFSSYRRMKSANTKNYIKIVETAESNGYMFKGK